MLRTLRFTTFIVIPSVAVAIGIPVAGRQAPDRPQLSMMDVSPVLKALDIDHDRVITAAELANAPSVLRGLDKNGDGKLGRDEAGAPFGARGRSRREGGRGEGRDEPPQIPAPGPTAGELLDLLMTFDRNGDGKLQKAEVPERQQGIFERGDANGDGVLDGPELRKLTADQAAAPVAPPRGGRGRGGFGRFDPAAAALDKDGNGEISADEIAGATAALKALDRNGDGRITEDEVAPAANEGRGAQA